MTVPYAPAALPPFTPASSPVVPAGIDVSTGPFLPAAVTCANCLAPLGGDFCSACGAPSLEQRPLTVRRFAGDLWTELTSVDSATVRSLRTLVLEPGQLTREYLRGRTRWFLSPLRLFLMTTTLLVFVSVVTGYQQHLVDSMREWSRSRGAQASVAYAEGFRQHLGHSYPQDNLLAKLLG